MMESFDAPGRIRCGTILCPDLAASEADYRDLLGLELIDSAPVSDALAAAWGAPAMAGRETRLLRAPGGTPYATRLVAGSAVPGFAPLKSHGWAAYEHTVVDCDALYARIKDSAFEVIGAPKLVPGFDNFIPFQVVGRAGEVLYLNQVLKSGMSDLDLPHTQAVVDQMFIAILAADDRAETVAFHVSELGFTEGQTWTIPYSVINNSFGLDAATLTAMTMTKTGRTPGCEIDQYPDAARARAVTPGELPPGNALVSFIFGSLDALRVPLLGPPVRIDDDLYQGRRAACVRGPSGEIIELIEGV
ncbi:VOC family protein [Polymorphobacter sp.]|uniref:VOC family protein n=1 Tax=Polymorphobacter sp. TaxID=1909290 RepID=UPI003F701CDA